MIFSADGRFYNKDLHDVFSSMVIQLPFGTHRIMFQYYDNTFRSEDAIIVLTHLSNFCTLLTNPACYQTNKKHDPSLTMSREMAIEFCQQFLDARLFENIANPSSRTFRDRAVWSITPKGLCILQDYCLSAQEDTCRLRKQFCYMNAARIVCVERSRNDNRLLLLGPSIGFLFELMMANVSPKGDLILPALVPALLNSPKPSVPFFKPASWHVSSSSSFSFSLNKPLLEGSEKEGPVRQLDNRQLISAYTKKYLESKHPSFPQTHVPDRTCFSTQRCCDWLVSYSTLSCSKEAEQVIANYLHRGWLFQGSKAETATATALATATASAKAKAAHSSPSLLSSSSGYVRVSNAVFLSLTEKGHSLATDWKADRSKHQLRSITYDPVPTALLRLPTSFSEPELTIAAHRRPTTTTTTTTSTSTTTSTTTTTNANETPVRLQQVSGGVPKLLQILETPSLQHAFGIFLKEHLCEENLEFWLALHALRSQSCGPKVKLSSACTLWITYVSPNSPRELNVAYDLRQDVDKEVLDMQAEINNTDNSICSEFLDLMFMWLDRVEKEVYCLLAHDAVPNFIKTPLYKNCLV
ncbi:hypothetical protein PHYBLDRAFT_65902 [Phycomyces blakesleeanus NRRL 1555(-)]|uniref:RGS domain-containing protein n=2 Tax=Phycomyces blakesleeanus TaxID=4837 RepID=A0A162NDF5_PHYB8|nr:hypothetical protein PHYBLDRAFT_65902 [Phycomyces blakesleeanus NRRL 1555(-)]OAD73298.1 hypothetical protein PHYBLDRAFT_65902 [Phycomyces blakesleeanus NRRL 1555(-)]|eukprot:XP_018291338.1 hypothetical protein PHYBLDRAFT_65902 [Phycomyces blakesleeanus NRRL 1555(-)]